VAKGFMRGPKKTFGLTGTATAFAAIAGASTKGTAV
jgi:hypothetical protein